MRIKIFPILSLILVFLSACTQGEKHKKSDLTLLFTTDVHGQMLNYDFLLQKTDSDCLSNVSTYVKQCREENEGGVILVDNGDLIEGNAAMYYYNIVDVRQEHLASRAMNFLKYDMINIGNHDFEGGEAVYLDHLYHSYQMPMLCANALDKRTGEPMFEPYCMVERKGYRIAFLGLVTADIPQWVPRTAIPHIRMISMMDAARHWIPIIEKKENSDIIIGLFHAGREEVERLDSMGVAYMDGALPVTRQVRGFDLVLIGHDHKTYQDTIHNRFGDVISVLQPAAHSEEIGRIDMHVEPTRKANGHHVIETTMQTLDVKEFEPDADYLTHFSGEIEKINTFLDRSIGQPIDAIDCSESLFGPSKIMDLIHSVQLNASYADISFSSCLSNFTEIPAGILTMRQLFSIYKYDNQMTKIWMTGHDVKKFLEYGYGLQFGQMKSEQDHLLNFILDKDGNTIIGRFGPELATPQYNYTSAAGIDYVVDVRNPVGSRVTILNMADGTPFDLNRRYDIVMSSFQAVGGGGFLTKGLGWDDDEIDRHTIVTTVKDMRYYIQQYIKQMQEGKRKPNIGKWSVVPTKWWQEAKVRDAEILLPYLLK